MPNPRKIARTQAWKDVPSCRSQGLVVEYVRLRGILMPPKSTPAQVAYFENLFKKVRETPDWKEFMETGAFKDTFMTGNAFQEWLLKAEVEHYRLMKEAGFIAN